MHSKQEMQEIPIISPVLFVDRENQSVLIT